MTIKNKNSKFKILFSLFIGFIVSFSIFYFTLYSQYEINSISDVEENFYSQSFDSNERKVFILGSSEILSINSTYINEIVSKSYPKIETYNLAIGSDFPKNRIYSMNLITSTKPELVIYGIGFRDFEKITPGGSAATMLLKTTTPEPSLIIPSKIIEEDFLSLVGFYNIDFDFLINPKIQTLKMLRSTSSNLSSDELNNQNDTRGFISNLPLWDFKLIDFDILPWDVTPKSQIEKTVSSDGKFIQIESPYKDRNVVSLKLIIEQLQKNGIDVIIFSTPHHESVIDSLDPDDLKLFESILEDVSNDYNIPVYFLHNKYGNLNAWFDSTHIAINSKYFHYSEDIAGMIINHVDQ